MPYTHITIGVRPAPLEVILEPDSPHNVAVRRELALVVAAPDLLAAAEAVTGMLEQFCDELAIQETTDRALSPVCHSERDSVGAFRRLTALRTAIAAAKGGV